MCELIARSLFALLVASAAICGQAAGPTEPVLPEPRGPHAVGLQRFVWTDTKRGEAATEDPDDRRRIAVDLWYPAEAAQAGDASKRPGYVPFGKVMQPQLREQYGARARRLLELRVPAREDAAPLRKPRKLPVLLFSHGLRTARFYYTAQALELASRGYVVCTLDHTYDVEAVALSEDELIRGDFRSEATGGVAPLNSLDAAASAKMRSWAEDHVFVLDQLERLRRGAIRSSLRGRLDLGRVAVAGHCYGGMAALETALLDDRVRAVITQNGWPVSSAVMQEGLRKTPVLALYSQYGVSAEHLLAQGLAPEKVHALQEPYHAERRSGLARVTNGASEVVLADTRHMSFSDLPSVLPWLHDPGLAAPRRNAATDLALELMLAFLEQELRGKKAPLLQEGAKLPEGVTLRRLD